MKEGIAVTMLLGARMRLLSLFEAHGPTGSAAPVTGLLVLRVRISEPRRRWIIPDPGLMLMAFMNGKQSISSFLTLMLIKRLIQYYRVYSHILMS